VTIAISGSFFGCPLAINQTIKRFRVTWTLRTYLH
jgi:hypothetical protein